MMNGLTVIVGNEILYVVIFKISILLYLKKKKKKIVVLLFYYFKVMKETLNFWLSG